jgi:hypothetical protein
MYSPHLVHFMESVGRRPRAISPVNAGRRENIIK